jgi:hypothetical protein
MDTDTRVAYSYSYSYYYLSPAPRSILSLHALASEINIKAVALEALLAVGHHVARLAKTLSVAIELALGFVAVLGSEFAELTGTSKPYNQILRPIFDALPCLFGPVLSLHALASVEDIVGALEAALAVGHQVARLAKTLSVAIELALGFVAGET